MDVFFDCKGTIDKAGYGCIEYIVAGGKRVEPRNVCLVGGIVGSPKVGFECPESGFLQFGFVGSVGGMDKDVGDEFVEKLDLIDEGTLGGGDLFGIVGSWVEDFFAFALSMYFATPGSGIVDGAFIDVLTGCKGQYDAGDVVGQFLEEGLPGVDDGFARGILSVDVEQGLLSIGGDRLQGRDLD